MSNNAEINKKSFYKKWWFWLIIILLLFIVIGSQGGSDVQNYVQDDENKLMSEVEWTNWGDDNSNQQYKIAVEIEGYQGDIIQAGNYKITQTNTVYDEYTERIYNIYVSNQNYDNFDDVQLTDYIGSVGGLQYENELNVSLEKGQFVYVSLIQGGQNGHFKMVKE